MTGVERRGRSTPDEASLATPTSGGGVERRGRSTPDEASLATPTSGGGVDRDPRPWWAALDHGDLLLQRCDECDAWRWPPRAACNRCGSFAVRWEAVSGRGTVASWIVNRHEFGARSSPYVVLLVRLDEQHDLLLPGASAGPPDGSDLELDAPVTVELEHATPTDGGEPVTLMRWKLDTTASTTGTDAGGRTTRPDETT